MLVKLVKFSDQAFTIKPADDTDTTILAIGVASWVSVRKTCKKNGWKIVGTVDRTRVSS